MSQAIHSYVNCVIDLWWLKPNIILLIKSTMLLFVLLIVIFIFLQSSSSLVLICLVRTSLSTVILNCVLNKYGSY
ncbi:hypothetical protein RCL_jg18450.t1 [Rhizophagus clarus]|uniref:Uncharacterized protein n=1 Tax=Rhizophagus clarus TaxID=94130 RepID=A0A8H3LGS5_9GLOM|nr:hypothetical protein RCL_jg18450.t1 [Rhizophagus clarus]